MAAACLPALTMLRVTTALLHLQERAAAGDPAALAELDALAGLLAPGDGKERDRLCGPSPSLARLTV